MRSEVSAEMIDTTNFEQKAHVWARLDEENLKFPTPILTFECKTV